MSTSETWQKHLFYGAVLLACLAIWIRIAYFAKFIGYNRYHPFVLFTALIFLFYGFARKSPRLSFTSLDLLIWLLIFIYGLIVGLSSVLNRPYVSWVYLVDSLSLPLGIFIFAFCLPELFSIDDYEKLFKHLLFFLAAMCFLNFYVNLRQNPMLFGQQVFPMDDRAGTLNRWNIYFHRNYCAHALQWLPALCAYTWTKYKKISALHIASLVIIAVQLLLCQSRAAFLVIALSLLPLFYFLWKDYRRIFWLTMLAGIVSAIGFVLFLPGLAETLQRGTSLSSRDQIWASYFKYWQNFGQIFLGYGFKWIIVGYRPHNLYLNQLFYYGILGFLAYIVLLGVFLLKVFRNLKGHLRFAPIQILCFLLLALLIGAFYDNYLNAHEFLPFAYFWILMGLLAYKKPAEILGSAISISKVSV